MSNPRSSASQVTAVIGSSSADTAATPIPSQGPSGIVSGSSTVGRAAANASGPGVKNHLPPAGLPLPTTPAAADSAAGATIRWGLSGPPLTSDSNARPLHQ